MWVGLAIAVVLLIHKSIQLYKMMRLGLPLSSAPLPYLEKYQPGVAQPVRP
jgi:hypothetical protein